MKPSNYLGKNSKPTDVIIQIFHTDKGKMVALNFAKDGYMVTMIEGKETTCITFAYVCSDRLWACNT